MAEKWFSELLLTCRKNWLPILCCTAGLVLIIAAVLFFLYRLDQVPVQVTVVEKDITRAPEKKIAGKEEAEPSLEKITAGEFFQALRQDGTDAVNLLHPDDATIASLEQSIQWIEKTPDDISYPFGQESITSGEIRKTLEALKRIYHETRDPDLIRSRMSETFAFYRLRQTGSSVEQGTGQGYERKLSKPPLLLTGYFQPEKAANPVRSSGFSFPLYATPEDLISVRLKDFDPELPGTILYGRLNKNRLQPYYTRYEIDTGYILPDSLALCWLQSYVDALEIQIQGSAIIDFPDGSRRFIHYAANNGRPYGSIGRWIIRNGYLPADGLDWPAIKQWAEENPELMQEAMKANPRYVFFKWEQDGPLGSLGIRLTDGRSAATDQSFYPPAIPVVLQFSLPRSPEYPDWIPADSPVFEKNHGKTVFSVMVFNHDRGAAIKGPGRVDLFCGSGDRAGALAGRLKARGELFLFLYKDVEKP